jgi:hypothetical protein
MNVAQIALRRIRQGNLVSRVLTTLPTGRQGLSGVALGLLLLKLTDAEIGEWGFWKTLKLGQ